MADTTRKAFGMQTEDLADKRQVVVNCSAEDPDRVGDVVVQKGIDFSSFMKIGGTVLWQHDGDVPVARAVEMSIVDDQLRAVTQFPPAGVSAKADEVYGLIRNKVINAASIGFQPMEWEPIDPKEPFGGRKFTKIELMEFSFVSVPCSRESTIVARSMNGATNKDASEWKVGASRNLPLDEDSSWDGPAAQKSVFDHCGFDGDSPNVALARKAFLTYDASNPKLKGSYKLPFAKMDGGRMTAVAAGIRAAASRLSQTDIPDDVQAKARAVIDHYEAKMKGDGKSLDDLALALSRLTPEQLKQISSKAGRAISAENLEHLKAMGDSLKGMQDCQKTIQGAHQVLQGYTAKAAKLHDDLHDTVVTMMDHGTSLGDHLKALLKSAKPHHEDDGDDSDSDSDDGADDASDDGDDGDGDDVADPSSADQELSAEAAARKRQVEMLERSLAS